MSYYRFTRLQQYINGQPTDVYAKGKRVDDVDYSTYEACMGSSADTRWVSIPQTVCYNGDLWSMEKEQISYDGGTSWSDTGNSKRASVIEQSSAQCFMNDWRVVPGEYICMMHAKWTKEAEYVSYDGGQTWTATGNIRRGETVIELLSADCGVIYQWIPTGEYICQGYNKYMKEKQVYSTDNGSTWTDTGNRRTGGLVEADSPYCGYEQYIYQWVDVAGEFYCDGYDKYTKQKEQRSSDNGQTWEDTGNTRAGEYIESLSTDCGVTYRWITVPNDYVCVGYDKYSKEKEQYSTDGSTWTDTGNTRAGSLIESDSEDCGYDPVNRYLTIEALGSGKITLNKHNEDGEGKYDPLADIQYSKNGGAWTSYTYGTEIPVVNGDKIRWKAAWNYGNDTEYGLYGLYSYFTASYNSRGFNHKVYGNPISLLVNDYFTNVTDISGFNAAFFKLFYNDAYLTDASKLTLPATILADECYDSMFMGCTSLTTAPALPATILADYCYNRMFSGCTSLTTAPVLPATTLENGCYSAMFKGCTSLTTAPSLPAITLTYSCYSSMFNGCTSLTAAPVLPATMLVEYCYAFMFNDCTSLNSVTCCATNNMARESTSYWLYNVSPTGTFTKVEDTVWAIPSGWTTDICDCGPSLPKIYLTIEALGSGTISLRRYYDSGFINYYPLKNIRYSKNDGAWTSYTYDTDISVVNGDKIRWNAIFDRGNTGNYYSYFSSTTNHKAYGNPISLFVGGQDFREITDISSYDSAFMYLFYNDTYLTDASNLLLQATILSEDCYNRMFQGCTSLTTAPVLPATTMSVRCYGAMFQGCTSLTTAPELPATTLARNCYQHMFEGCTSLTAAPALPATTLARSCYNSMFSGCTSITVAPALPATMLVEYCYIQMFSGCTSLNSVTCCAIDISETDCTKDWLLNVSSTGTFNKDSNTTWPTGTSGIPSGWTTDTCGCEPYEKPYLTITSLQDNNEIKWIAPNINVLKTISVSTDNGQTWTDKRSSTDTGTTLATLNTGDKLLLKGLNSNYCSDYYGPTHFRTTKNFNVSGNIMSLIGGDNFANITSFTKDNAYAFEKLFIYCTHLVDASNLILPATTLAESCYESMFKGCTNLATPPALPATTLAKRCYQSMFEDCTSLTTAPALPATTLADSCYSGMFRNCSNINYIKCLAIGKSASFCTLYWLKGVSSTGTFTRTAGIYWSSGDSGIPSGWTVQNA